MENCNKVQVKRDISPKSTQASPEILFGFKIAEEEEEEQEG